MTIKLTRRKFIQLGGACAIPLSGWARPSPGASTAEYKALVCIDLGGGADTFSMLLPEDPYAYQPFHDRRRGLAPAHHELLKWRVRDEAGNKLALHPGLVELQPLFARGEMTAVTNVGPMLEPHCTSSRPPIPDLSHRGLISQWHSGHSGSNPGSGWLGRIADVLEHSSTSLPINLSLSGKNLMQMGANSCFANLQQDSYRSRGCLPVGVDFMHVKEQMVECALQDGSAAMARKRQDRQKQADTQAKEVLGEVLPETDPIQPVFAPDSFSSELARVARMIGARKSLNARRQIFYVHFDGWDQHHDLLSSQEILFPMLSAGLASFREALGELGVLDQVTTFTVSEFGRALDSNGSGTDHGWAGNHFVMGGAVRGGRVLGQYPDLSPGSSADIGGGCLAPTLSTTEYFAELALWFGVAEHELAYVLPDIHRFRTPGNSSLLQLVQVA